MLTTSMCWSGRSGLALWPARSEWEEGAHGAWTHHWRDWAMGTPGTDAGRVGRIGECVVYGCAESGAGDVEQIMVVAGEDLVSQD